MAIDIGGVYKASPTQMVDSQQRSARLTQFGALVVSMEDQSGNGAGTAASPVVTANIGSGSLATSQVTVPTTAGGTQIAAARAARRTILITNLGTTDVFVGNTGLTTANGQILPGTKGATLTLDTAAAVYGITASVSQAVSFIELF